MGQNEKVEKKRKSLKSVAGRLKRKYKEMGWMLGLEYDKIPEEHRINRKNGKGLRCFKKRWQKNEQGERDYDLPKVRCGMLAEKGSFFCRFHGARKKTEKQLTKAGATVHPYISALRGEYAGKLGDLLSQFINDPDAKSMKGEVATLRTVLINFIAQVRSNKPLRDPARLCGMIRGVLKNELYTNGDKFTKIKKICENEYSLTDLKVIDKINKTIHVLSSVIERMHKVETSGDYFLTPTGLKMLLGNVLAVLKTHVKDSSTLDDIIKGLYDARLQTKGVLINRVDEVQDAVFTVRDEDRE